MNNHTTSKRTARVLSGLVVLSGTVLGILTAPLIKGGVVNLLWGTLYGLGFWIASLFVSPQTGWTGGAYLFIGAVIWPLALTIGILFAFENWLSHEPYRRRAIFAAVASLVVVFPMQEAPGTFVYYLPIFSAFLENI